MDSIGANELTDTTLLQIATVYKTNTQLLRVKYSAVQLQKGAHDCGLFSIANAIEVCEGNDPAKQQYRQERMRKHLLDCFTKKHLLPFPKANKGTKPHPRPKATYQTFKIYCQCQMPDIYDTFMINCDSCHKWFHHKCVGLDHDDIESDAPSKWKCPKCCT